MRKYQPIWEEIKKHNKISLIAPIERHTRIVTAVRKEKLLDAGWKLLHLENGKRFKLKDISAGKMITFTLEEDQSCYIKDMEL